MTAKELIESLPQRFKPDMAEGINALFHFDISGTNGGQYTVSVKDKTCTVQQGLQGDASCVVKASDEDYTEIIEGRQNAMTAFMFGKIKVSNLSELMRLKDAFQFKI